MHNRSMIIPTSPAGRWTRTSGPALLAVAAAFGAHAADAPMRGNPVDSLPQIESASPPAKAPVALPAAPVAPEIQARLARRIVPRHFAVSGVTAIPFDDVVALLTPLAGKEISIGELAERAQLITKLYQERGYALSLGMIQEQSFEGGLVKVTVIEGYVAKTRIEGDAGGARDALARYASRIEADRPLRLETLERYLNLMAQLPGVKIKPELPAPQRADGVTELVLNATHQPVTGNVFVGQVGNSPSAILGVNLNSVTPLAEQLQLNAAVPGGRDKLQYYALSYRQPIGDDGLTLRGNASLYKAEPRDEGLRSLGLARNLENQRVGVSLGYPILLSNTRSLNVSAGLYAANNVDRYSRIADGASVSLVSHTRVAQADITYAEASAQQSRSVTAGISKGLEGLGANQASTTQYDLGFTRFNLGATQNLVLPAGFGLSGTLAAQFSGDTLPPSEQITFGGQRFGAGYPSGAVGGDSGMGLSLEVNRKFAAPATYLKTITPYFLVDTARVRVDDPLPGQGREKLASAALGLRFSDDRYYSLDLSVAKPIGDRPINETNRPLRFNLSYTLQIE